MTCFWDGILHHLTDDDFQRVLKTTKPNNKNFVKILKQNLKHTRSVKWNDTILTNKQCDENYEHIRDFNAETIYGGYLCSTCDPFLLLVCELFNVDINHNFCGNIIRYRINNSNKILNFRSDRGHFTHC